MENVSPNPRPRTTRRVREGEDATAAQPGVVRPSVSAPQAPPAAAAQAPPQQEQQAQAPPPAQRGSPPTPPQAPHQSGLEAMLGQFLQFVAHSQQRQQEQFDAFLTQQTQFQQQMLAAQLRSRAPTKKKGDPPMFNGKADDDLELWIFSTEQYYSDHQEEMQSNSSVFVDTIFANLGTVAQTWFRDFKLSLGPQQPATWALFKQRIRERFRDRDFQQKVLTKLFELRASSSQQEYTSKFLHLLSQLDSDMPEYVKRWFFQQNLKADTSSFVSRNIPDTLQYAIELAQRFEDSRPAHVLRKSDHQSKSSQKTQGQQREALRYHDADPIIQRTKAQLYCYLAQLGSIGDVAVEAFVDSGASFNAISPSAASKLKLKVTTCKKPLQLTLGTNQKVIIPRKVTRFTVQLKGFPAYETEAFVMDVPEDKHVLLGLPWLSTVNPEIDWTTKEIKHRSSSDSAAFHQCAREASCQRIHGRRQRRVRRQGQDSSHEDVMLYYAKHVHLSKFGETRVIPRRRFRKLKTCYGEFCFAVRVLSDKAMRQLETDWDKIKGHPVERIAVKYRDSVFRDQLPATPPERTRDVVAEIELTDATPVARKQFRLSEEMKQAVREWTKEMLEAGIIRPSKSPYSSPTFCVKKPVGWRVVHDFRAINAKLRVPATPVPRKEDIFDAMASGRIFSAMDLLWGFFQVRLRERDIPYTAFSTPDGLFEYLVAPMGLSSSPSAFNRLIQDVFKDQHEFCRAYFDDLFVFTKSDDMDEHLAALDKVLARCEEQQLCIKLSKCTFCSTEIPCLGDYIGRDGVRMDPDKIRVIRDWPLPKTKKDLQSFIGTCVYVLKYCPDFAELSAPLTDAFKGKTMRESITLSKQQLDCFEQLKARLSSPPILCHPDWSRPFHVSMDASDYAVGGYLFQLDDENKERIVAYGGRKMTTAERMYPTREKELLAALHAMRTWHVDDVDSEFLQYARQRPPITEQCKRLYDEDTTFGPLVRHFKEAHTSPSMDISTKIRANLKHFFLDDDLLYFQPDVDEPRRLCVPDDQDLRNLIVFECHDTLAPINAKLRVPATPVPRKEDIFDAMASGRIFSAMDLLWGFFQVRLRERDIPYTAFSTPDGLFEYLVAPMGLSSSPSAFNRLIQDVFKDQHEFCRAYFDDLFVFTKSDDMDEHLAALDKVLARCEEQQLCIKLSKCTFCSTEIPCLGDYIGRDGVRMDPDKIRVIRDWPLPKTKKDLQSFIGTCVYVLKYCPDFAELSAPLTDAFKGKTMRESITLSKQQLDCFEQLKARLSSPPILCHPDWSRPFHVSMDASDYAVGGYLFQLDDENKERIVAYGGRKMTTAERMYPTREKELLAALHAMRTWHVDDVDSEFLQYARQRPPITEQCKRLYDEDTTFGPLVRHFKEAHTSPSMDISTKIRANLKHFFLDDDLLYFQPDVDEPRRLCVPDDQDLRNLIVFECHDTLARGHPGVHKTLLLLQQKYYWLNMHRFVKRKRWSHIAMDFIAGLPKTVNTNYDAILVIVDRLTKRAHFLATTKNATAADTAALFVAEHVRLHGFPVSIVSDRDPRFLSAFWRAVMNNQGTQLQVSTSFKPSTDGQNERSHRFVNDYLRAFIAPAQTNWDRLLAMAEFAYNSRPHSSIGMSPFVADLGYAPRALDDLHLRQHPPQHRAAASFLEHQAVILRRCQDALELAQANMKYFYDRNRPTHSFKLGDQVLLDTENLDLSHIGTFGTRKFAARFIGPYKVLALTQPDTYKISLPPGLRLHDEFHVSYLRPYVEDTNPKRLNNVPRLITRDGSEGLQVHSIVGHKTVRGVRYFKVRWALLLRSTANSVSGAHNKRVAQNSLDSTIN
ncbi:hypothetical protein P43SY_010819 [Pythium insidiosum]|uniref:Integrase catalytic domain-containing protein n=1 Tax=Pythium insidiosum TaxID=114742 RepID=A0AAD5Q3Q3_PYTIN|nr:hypothetical protein P43SY_010819 [Pythium insidiosum]